jgi:polyphosphate kinase 2 (PPK2 family)
MLEKVDLTLKLPKEENKRQMPRLQRRLYDLEKACWDANVPSIIVFEGWDAAGKGTSISKLTSRLDPRGFKLYPIREARTFEKHLPWLWRFWLKTPNYGEMAIFDRSWYGRVLVERVEGLTPVQEWRKGYRDIVDFERNLADDGYVIVKFWLHISKKEQKRRFKKLEKNPLTRSCNPWLISCTSRSVPWLSSTRDGTQAARAATSSASPRNWTRAATKCTPSPHRRARTRRTTTYGASGGG